MVMLANLLGNGTVNKCSCVSCCLAMLASLPPMFHFVSGESRFCKVNLVDSLFLDCLKKSPAVFPYVIARCCIAAAVLPLVQMSSA